MSFCFNQNSPSKSRRFQLTPGFIKAAGPHRTWVMIFLLTFHIGSFPLKSSIIPFSLSFHEAISFPVGVTEITIPFPIVKAINSFMINLLPAPNTKLRWLQTKTLEEKKVIANSLNCNNFYLLNILSQMNYLFHVVTFLSLISQFKLH